MKLEVHTFDPEFVNALMRKQPVPEGEVLELGSDARLVYVRTFSGRVKHFPQIVHFDVELLTDRGSGMISSWLFEHVGRRSIERILADHQDIKLDVDRLRDALDRSR